MRSKVICICMLLMAPVGSELLWIDQKLSSEQAVDTALVSQTTQHTHTTSVFRVCLRDVMFQPV